MTIEEKAKAYDNAIAKAKNLYNSVFVNNDVLEEIFPQLVESEEQPMDEKIRQYLIQIVDAIRADDLELIGLNKEEVLAYLEKRETVKKIRYELDAPLSHDINGIPIYFEDLHSAEWSEEDETCLEDALWCVMKTRHFVAKDACDLDACRSAERWLNFLPKRFNLQPKQEWSEEDTKMLEATIAFVKHCPFSRIGRGKNNVLAWLKALSMNLKKPNESVAKLCSNEWSEKDEEHINSIFNDFKQGVIPDEEDQEWLKNRLKSLRPQPHTVSIKNATKFGNLEYERGVKDGIQNEKNRQWKPSKEQMEALNEVINTFAVSKHPHENDYLFNILNGLRKNLKSL